MFWRSFAVLFLTTLAQISAQLVSVEEAQAELNKMREDISDALNAALKTYMTMSVQIDFYSLTTKSNGTEVIQAYAEEYFRQYEDIKKPAVEAEVDITVCLNNIEVHVINLGRENIDNLNMCVDAQIASALEYINLRILETIKTGLDLIHENEIRLIRCGKFDSFCLYEIASKIKTDADFAYLNIASLISSYGDVFIIYNSNIRQLCGERYTSTTMYKGESLIKDFQDCVNYFSNNLLIKT